MDWVAILTEKADPSGEYLNIVGPFAAAANAMWNTTTVPVPGLADGQALIVQIDGPVAALRIAAPAGETLAGQAERIACDLVAVSGGWSPAVHLFAQSGG